MIHGDSIESWCWWIYIYIDIYIYAYIDMCLCIYICVCVCSMVALVLAYGHTWESSLWGQEGFYWWICGAADGFDGASQVKPERAGGFLGKGATWTLTCADAIIKIQSKYLRGFHVGVIKDQDAPSWVISRQVKPSSLSASSCVQVLPLANRSVQQSPALHSDDGVHRLQNAMERTCR